MHLTRMNEKERCRVIELGGCSEHHRVEEEEGRLRRKRDGQEVRMREQGKLVLIVMACFNSRL